MVTGPKTTLVLQRYTDNYTTKTRTWADLRELSGVLADLSGREAFIIGQLKEKAEHEFYCDIPKGITITASDRLRDKKTLDRFYKIKRVVTYETHAKLTLESGTGKNVG